MRRKIKPKHDSMCQHFTEGWVPENLSIISIVVLRYWFPFSLLTFAVAVQKHWWARLLGPQHESRQEYQVAPAVTAFFTALCSQSKKSPHKNIRFRNSL